MRIRIIASGSSGNCYTVSDGYSSLLLECGIPIRTIQQATDYRLTAMSGCLISHEHNDHSHAIGNVLRAGVDVCLSAGTISALNIKHHRARVVQHKEEFTVGGFDVLPLNAQHDAAEPLMFAIQSQKTGERVLYATDTCYVKYTIPGLTHLMLECNYSKAILDTNIASGAVPEEFKRRLARTHLSLETVKGFLRANDLSRIRAIYLLHLSNRNSNALEFKREIQELTGKVVIIA